MKNQSQMTMLCVVIISIHTILLTGLRCYSSRTKRHFIILRGIQRVIARLFFVLVMPVMVLYDKQFIMFKLKRKSIIMLMGWGLFVYFERKDWSWSSKKKKKSQKERKWFYSVLVLGSLCTSNYHHDLLQSKTGKAVCTRMQVSCHWKMK